LLVVSLKNLNLDYNFGYIVGFIEIYHNV